MKIVLTGSLGHISKPLAETLVKEGHSVTIISSNTKRQKEIESIGATAAIGLLDNLKFLMETFSGADAVFCMIPPSYTQPDQIAYYQALGANYKKAIIESGIKKVIHLSSYGAHLPSGTGFISGSYHVEQILNSIDNIQLTHIRPTSFYYNLQAFVSMIKSAGFIGSVYGGNDILAMVSTNDIAKAVAEEIVKIEHIAPIRYVGSDYRTCNEVASILGKAIGMPDLKWITLSKEDVRNGLMKNGLSEEYANNLVELGDAIHTGKLREDYDLHKPELGKIKIEAYAEEFAQAFHTK